eukprot:324104-Heterocapsa_arctica.AAC.1
MQMIAMMARWPLRSPRCALWSLSRVRGGKHLGSQSRPPNKNTLLRRTEIEGQTAKRKRKPTERPTERERGSDSRAAARDHRGDLYGLRSRVQGGQHLEAEVAWRAQCPGVGPARSRR